MGRYGRRRRFSRRRFGRRRFVGRRRVIRRRGSAGRRRLRIGYRM